MGQWQAKLARLGFELVDDPQPAMRPSRDPARPAQDGWWECIIGAHWKHHGPVMVMNRDYLESKREEEERIGAGQLKGDGGVNRYLRAHPGTQVLN